MRPFQSIRTVQTNEAPVNAKGDFVLYWVIANRRMTWNYSLDRAVDWAQELDRPLVVFEALRCGYPWASDRLHRFILDGMAANAGALKKRRAWYYPYVEPEPDADKGLLQCLAEKACVVVTDDFPAFFIPRMVASASKKMPVRVEAVDSNGLLPMRAADKVFPTAYAFRRFLQRHLPTYLVEHPREDPLKAIKLKTLKAFPKDIMKRWPMTPADLLEGNQRAMASLPINHEVKVGALKGGTKQARYRLKHFINEDLDQYAESRNQPEMDVTSGLSPYLHFGHISVHEIFHSIIETENWFFDRLSPTAKGSRSGWWGMSEAAEAFLDELITWRELGYNMCWQRDDYDRYESLPEWASATLKAHEKDPREHVYTLKEFENAGTHDPLWNAAQIQLVREGRIHNYLRMLWGKKILEWSASPRKALGIMIELNNKYALDGRDPNSYSGIFWVLGRYDRAWGPERPVYGKVRYMSSRNTARKVRVRKYIERYAP